MANNIGDNIRKRRSALRLSQKKVADYLGITQQAYSKYENNLNSFNFETALKLGEILEISLDALGLDYRNDKPELSNQPAPEVELTDREQTLIDKYRQLTLEDKNRVDERIDTMLESYPENKESVS